MIRVVLFAVFAVFVFVKDGHAAWYLDRSNDMSDANDDVGESMAVVFTRFLKSTQAIQVCSGVFLATAHGALDNPIEAAEQNDNYRKPGEFAPSIVHYPFYSENLRSTKIDSNYISPRLRNLQLWEKKSENYRTDYAFVKIDNPLRPNSFITPLFIDKKKILEYKDSLKISMYRGKTRFKYDTETGLLDFNQDTAVPETGHDLARIYQKAQKVNEYCKLSYTQNASIGLVSHNCPTEPNSSGSSYVTKINGKNYLIGLNTTGRNLNISTDTNNPWGSSMLTSSEFCGDYEKACGRPCLKLEDVLGYK